MAWAGAGALVTAGSHPCAEGHIRAAAGAACAACVTTYAASMHASERWRQARSDGSCRTTGRAALAR